MYVVLCFDWTICGAASVLFLSLLVTRDGICCSDEGWHLLPWEYMQQALLLLALGNKLISFQWHGVMSSDLNKICVQMV
jgi:hypothetical protein